MIGRILPFLLLAIAAGTVVSAPPFVAGYDRFAMDPSVQSGRILLSELGCTACHAVGQDVFKAKQGPDLHGVGLRLQRDWVEQFLASPTKTKPGTTMPSMFAAWDADEKQSAIEALTAFLMTQRAPLPQLKSTASNPIAVRFWEKGDPTRGRDLYHQVGCIACHEVRTNSQHNAKPASTLDEETLEEVGITPPRPVRSVPHPDLPSKYSLQSLTHFLIDPLATRPSGRMPNLKLTPDEAADIAAYLMPEQVFQVPAAATVTDARLVAKGRVLFQELGCLNCHSAGGATKKLSAPDLAKLDAEATASCVGTPRKGLPSYPIDDSQRASIQQALRKPNVENLVDVRMRQLNCYACHERDGKGGVGPERRQFFETVAHVDLGDEGRIPPSLTAVGRKLTNQWMANVLAGTGNIRPHLRTRMPVFGDAAKSLAGEFSAVDLPTNESDTFDGSTGSAEAGRMLLDTGCVQCHPLRQEHLPGVMGTDLAEIDKRVRPAWFREFLLDPAGVKNRTRMPSFFRNGESPSPEILDGDIDRQIASMWVYLSQINQHPLPDKIQQGRVHNFELIPRDKPIILRTFMDRAGPHAIAVGFPQKVHLAFDAETVGIAQFWRGRFLDAHGTWFDRFTPPAKPLGQDVIDLTDQTDPSTRKFRGYRIDSGGVPTFLYRIGKVDVEDRYQPSGKAGFVRSLTLSPQNEQTDAVRFRLSVIAGKQLQHSDSTVVRTEDGLTVSITLPENVESRIESSNGMSTCSIYADVVDVVKVKMEYQW